MRVQRQRPHEHSLVAEVSAVRHAGDERLPRDEPGARRSRFRVNTSGKSHESSVDRLAAEPAPASA